MNSCFIFRWCACCSVGQGRGGEPFESKSSGNQRSAPYKYEETGVKSPSGVDIVVDRNNGSSYPSSASGNPTGNENEPLVRKDLDFLQQQKRSIEDRSSGILFGTRSLGSDWDSEYSSSSSSRQRLRFTVRLGRHHSSGHPSDSRVIDRRELQRQARSSDNSDYFRRGSDNDEARGQQNRGIFDLNLHQQEDQKEQDDDDEEEEEEEEEEVEIEGLERLSLDLFEPSPTPTDTEKETLLASLRHTHSSTNETVSSEYDPRKRLSLKTSSEEDEEDDIFPKLRMGCFSSKSSASKLGGGSGSKTPSFHDINDDACAALDAFKEAAARAFGRDGCPKELGQIVRTAIVNASEKALVEGKQGLELHFEGEQIGEQGSTAISEMITRACAIRSLSLVKTGVTHIAALEIGRGLRSNVLLVSLNLSGNNLGEKGLRGVLKYMNVNKTLKELYLSDTGLNENCANLIANRLFLSENKTLLRLDVSNNGLNDRSLESLVRALPCHPRIRHVNIAGNGGPSPHLKRIQQMQNYGSSDDLDEDIAIQVGGGVTAAATTTGGGESNKNNNNNKASNYNSGIDDLVNFLTPEECEKQISRIIQRNMEVADIIDMVLNNVTRVASSTSDEGGEIGRANNNGITTIEEEDDRPMAGEMTISEFPFSFGFAETRGRRKRMEDITFIRRRFRKNSHEHLFGIFDGHGGVECAQFVNSCFIECLERELNLAEQDINKSTDERAWIKDATIRAVRSIQTRCAYFQVANGACALVTYFKDDFVHTATVGDSRALLITKDFNPDNCRWLSEILTPKHPQERERIEKQGGFITDNGRVCGILAVSRALGDIQYTQMISSEPTVQSYKLGARDKWIILGCDGVWDVLTIEIVVQLLKFVEDPIRASQKLRNTAYNMGSKDNISVVCIKIEST